MGAYFRNTPELKRDVLSICGELSNGTSSYDALAVTYLNKVYQGLLAGGNEFGVQVAEPWIWAKSKQPIKIALTPAITGTATLTQGSFAGTFSVAPSQSLAGRFIKFDARPDVYKIVSHVAASTAFSIDQEYLASSGALGYTAYKMDYKCENNVIVIDTKNNKIDFSEDGAAELTATLTAGVYSPTTLCAEIKTRMEAVGAETYTITFDSITRKFSIAHGGATLELWFLTGTNVKLSTSEVLGYEMEDLASATSYEAKIPLSAINRFIMPLTTYRDYNGGAAKESGKIFMLDALTMQREYPMSRMVQTFPDKFCVTEQSPEGLNTIRFNASVVDEEVRIELDYIPVTRSLCDADASYPLVPGAHSEYLVHAASYYLLMEKADNKAESYKLSAGAKLLALVNENRKGLELAGNNFGRIVPRPSGTKINGWRNS